MSGEGTTGGPPELNIGEVVRPPYQPRRGKTAETTKTPPDEATPQGKGISERISTLVKREKTSPAGQAALETQGVRVENARHQDFAELADAKDVYIRFAVVEEVGSFMRARIEDIKKRKTAGAAISPFEELLLRRGEKWVEWHDYLKDVKAGNQPTPPEALTRNDARLGYLLLLDEILQRGVFLGVEVDKPNLGKDRLLQRINPLFKHGYRRIDEPFNPSQLRAMGLMTDYTESVYRDTRDMRRV